MIDIENDVFGAVAPSIREKYNASVYGEYIDTPEQFPCVTIFQTSNSVINRMRTSQRIENAVQVLFSVDVYTNIIGYKKQQAKQIMADIDGIMTGLGFRRSYCSPTSNLADATIYRMTARYEASVQEIVDDETGESHYRICEV